MLAICHIDSLLKKCCFSLFSTALKKKSEKRWWGKTTQRVDRTHCLYAKSGLRHQASPWFRFHLMKRAVVYKITRKAYVHARK